MSNLKRNEKGFTLLEVLISLVILSFGLLGMAGLQGASLKNNMIAYHRSQATILGFEVLESMRANRDAVDSYEIAVAVGGNLPAAGTTIAADDLEDWFDRIRNRLPNGGATITNSAGNIWTVTIVWQARGLDTDGAANTQSFVVSTEL